ncbi:MAG: hypothetical protein MI923_30665 [Phycisphaerales bacterium]|nr:hypothetical protein [Phycisphaerales bacterium]
MSYRQNAVIVALLSLCLAAPTALAVPDVIVGGLGVSGNNGSNQNDIVEWGTLGGIMAYSVATTSCNVGTSSLLWIDEGFDLRHPVIAQNMFRLMDGKFEHIGQSWLKHGFCALDQDLCDNCANTGTCNVLGVGCSDPYTGARNGSGGSGCDGFLGPKSDVNATTGVFSCPFSRDAVGSAPTIGRLQVHTTDLAIAGAQYYFEGQYVTQDDAQSGNGYNSVSWREVSVAGAPNYTALPLGPTVTEEPAIFAWQDADPFVKLLPMNDADGGRFWLGYRVTDLGGGMWHYEYAVQNLNSHASGQSFSIPVPAGVSVSNIGFHDCDYHSGEIHSGTDWGVTVGGSSITWATNTWTAGNDLTTNALRWGTLYNFRFDANTPPVPGAVATLGLFRPIAPSSLTSLVLAPAAPEICDCPGDLDDSTTVDGADIQNFVDMYIGNSPVGICAELDGPTGVPLDSDDLDAFVSLLVNGTVCP